MPLKGIPIEFPASLEAATVFVAIALLEACGGGGGGSAAPAPAPSITGFTADSSTVTMGQMVKLTAIFTNGSGSFDQGVGSVTSGQPITIGALKASTTFTLTVTGTGGTATATKTVTVTRFTAVGPLATVRSQHTATLLPGGKVLVVGGVDASGKAIASAELYDPSIKAFSSTGSLQVARASHTATLLNNGKVLIFGLGDGITANVPGEIYDPSTGQFTTILPITYAPKAHTATLLANGKVVIAGGALTNNPISTVLIFDPATGLISASGAPLHRTPRRQRAYSKGLFDARWLGHRNTPESLRFGWSARVAFPKRS